MIPFFPTPYNDEILYSVLGRYHIRSGNISLKQTITELYGKNTRTAVIDLPSNINKLLSNLPLLCTVSAKELISKNTLFPFYSPFLFKEQASAIELSMINEKGNTIHTRAGIIASPIKQKSSLYLCKSCYIESIEDNGEAYWHRVHQVPGVKVCPHHKEILLKGKDLNTVNRHEFTNANFYEESKKQIQVYDETILEYLFEISRDVYTLLKNNYEFCSPQLLNAMYLKKLKEKGLAYASGRVKQKKLQEQFLMHYSEELLIQLNSNINENEDNWLAAMVRKPRKSIHPIRHLLFIRFLTSSLETFFEELKTLSNTIDFNNDKTRLIRVKKERISLDFECLRNEKRRNWLNLINEFPDYRKTQLRKKEYNLYFWLYRYDKVWLELNSPSAKKTNNIGRKRVDWVRRDLLFKEELKQVILDWDDEKNPVRRTKNAIVRRTGKLHYLGKLSELLPQSMEFLSSVIESLDDFQKRRIDFVIMNQKDIDGELREWQILRAAGINHNHSNIALKHIKERMKELTTI